jgi:hypothetical protein
VEEIGLIDTRKQMNDFLDGYSQDRKEELDERKAKQPLVKSYLLEKSCENGNKDIVSVFCRRGITLQRIEDERLWKVHMNSDNSYFGFLESFDERYFSIYTMLESVQSDKWIRNLVLGTPEIDNLWISGWTFNHLWRKIVEMNNPQRYVRIEFLHNSIFEVDIDENDSDEEDLLNDDENHHIPIEKRAAKFSLVDKIGTVDLKLKQLQNIYSPLYAISRLRFPSATGRGGHDFYDNGKVTNRSDSFLDHRNHLLYVQRIYERLTNETEKVAWFSVDGGINVPGEFNRIVGSPVVVIFSEPLTEATYNHLIDSTFNNPRNKFRLWGNPIKMGANKVHVYGLDRHLWQPIFLEITNKQIICIVPRGTCGNTINRLITNIQRYLDPGAKAFVGDKKYDDIIKSSSSEVNYVSK